MLIFVFKFQKANDWVSPFYEEKNLQSQRKRIITSINYFLQQLREEVLLENKMHWITKANS